MDTPYLWCMCVCYCNVKIKWRMYSSHTLQFRELSPLDMYKAQAKVQEPFLGDARNNEPDNTRKERRWSGERTKGQ